MSNLKAVILAAGMGTRMKSKTPKVLHKIMDQTMVEYVIEAARKAGCSDICLVVGHGADQVRENVGDSVSYVVQKEQLGTGHAVKCAADFIGSEGDTLVLCGDTPLIRPETLKAMTARHEEKGNAVTLLSTILENPKGYGRIIRDDAGEFVKNVEDKDATDEERDCREVNSGMYLFRSSDLSDSLSELKNDNAQGEYYLPDTLTIIKNKGGHIDAVTAEDETEIMGVNSRVQLSEAAAIMQKRINTHWMEEGVTIIAPELTFIGPHVTLGRDVTIYPNTFIYGDAKIDEGTVISPNTLMGLQF